MRLAFPDSQETNQRLRNWVAGHMEGVTDSGYQCIGVLDDNDDLAAAVMFHNYRHPSIEIGLISENANWVLHRRMVRQVMQYPFEQLQCSRITALVHAKKKRLRRLLRLMGFKEEGQLRKAAPDRGDIFIYGLLRDEKLWRNNSSRRARSTSSTRKRASTKKSTAKGSGTKENGRSQTSAAPARRQPLIRYKSRKQTLDSTA